MANISSMTLPNGDTYDLKDKIARVSIPYAQVDATSTATVYTATVEGITELYDGVTVMLHNGVVTSASEFTININNLGALPVYSNMATGNTVTPTTPTRETTIFNINYTMLFTYSSTIVSGGGWICYRGYDANTNTIGYQLRTNSTVRNVSDTARYYKLYFTSADNTMWVPASVNSTNNATAARPVNQRPIDPFGPIVYTSASTNYAAGANLAATTIWEQYTLVLGYSFNRTGAALNLTVEAPVYVKCAPQANGSAIMDADTPIVQALPTTKDGKIYIYLGIAYDATHIELVPKHPVYWHDGTGIRLWTGAEPSAGGSTVSVSQTLTSGTEIGSISVDGTATKLYAPTPQSITVDSELSSTSENPVQNKVINSAIAAKYTKPSLGIPASDLAPGAIPSVPSGSSESPKMDGTASAGTSGAWARGDHVHPTDTSRQATLVSGTNIKTINNTSLLGSGDIPIPVITVDSALSKDSTNPVQNGVITNALDAKAPLDSPDLIGTPTAPTAESGTNTTQIATTAFVKDAVDSSVAHMTILSYGSSTWSDFLTAYQEKSIVYCRASSNSNPATGSQTRLAFMAYVNNAANPTEVEFQYYRSVSTHSDSQQGDQVYVYKITSSNTWSVTVRSAFTKIVAGTNLTSSYNNGVLTLNGQSGLPTVSASDNGKVLTVVNGVWAAAALPVYDGSVT